MQCIFRKQSQYPAVSKHFTTRNKSSQKENDIQDGKIEREQKYIPSIKASDSAMVFFNTTSAGSKAIFAVCLLSTLLY